MEHETITIFIARTMVRNGVPLLFGLTEMESRPGWWRLFTRGLVVVNSRGKDRVYKSINSAVQDLCFVFGSKPFDLIITPIFQPEEADK